MKLRSLLLVLPVAVALTGCGSSDDSASNDKALQDAQAKIKSHPKVEKPAATPVKSPSKPTTPTSTGD